VADDVEVVGVLDRLNRAGRGTWHLAGRLGGGRKTGAWVAEDRDGVRAGDAWRAVFGDGSAWRTALRRQSPEALEAGQAIARRAAPFRDATSGWEPEAVTAYLLNAASLFDCLS
jgi:hypothetical protein